MIDGDAPFSAIGVVELKLLFSSQGENLEDERDPFSTDIAHYRWWQYGTGLHSSSCHAILGPVTLNCQTDNGNSITVRHGVVEGSLQLLDVQNVTRPCNHLQIKDNRIQLPVLNDHQDYISLIDNKTHNVLPLSCFSDSIASLLRLMSTLVSHNTATSSSGTVAQTQVIDEESLSRPLSEVPQIIKRVNDHVCGHESIDDLRTFL